VLIYRSALKEFADSELLHSAANADGNELIVQLELALSSKAVEPGNDRVLLLNKEIHDTLRRLIPQLQIYDAFQVGLGRPDWNVNSENRKQIVDTQPELSSMNIEIMKIFFHGFCSVKNA